MRRADNCGGGLSVCSRQQRQPLLSDPLEFLKKKGGPKAAYFAEAVQRAYSVGVHVGLAGLKAVWSDVPEPWSDW